MGLVVSIHQPTFFPWLSFFDKIIRADLFVILDDAQFPKTGGCWINRVKIIVNSEAKWITMPVIRSYSGVRKINEMLIDNSVAWRQKIQKTIDLNYRKSEYFETIYPVVSDLINFQTDSVFEFNIKALKKIFSLLRIDEGKIRYSSELKTEGTATDLLISIVKYLNGDTYMCGAGASKYQEDDKFSEAGIKLLAQNFKHPVYPQFNTKSFVQGLSVIDSLMNCGIDGVHNLTLVNLN